MTTDPDALDRKHDVTYGQKPKEVEMMDDFLEMITVDIPMMEAEREVAEMISWVKKHCNECNKVTWWRNGKCCKCLRWGGWK